MIELTNDWHQDAVAKIKASLTPRSEVLAVAVFGSIAALPDRRDELSDVDLLIVVAAEVYDTYALERHWLKEIGQIVGLERLETDGYTTLRVCLADFRRFDIVVATDESVLSHRLWRAGFLGQPVHILFCRSEALASTLEDSPSVPSRLMASPQAFSDLAERFWFRAALAGYKVARKDRWVALHQVLDLARECCVLAMMLRDRTQAERALASNREIHNVLIRALANTDSENSAIGILGLIESCAEVFDDLSERWSESCTRRSPALREWLALCRHRLEMS